MSSAGAGVSSDSTAPDPRPTGTGGERPNGRPSSFSHDSEETESDSEECETTENENETFHQSPAAHSRTFHDGTQPHHDDIKPGHRKLYAMNLGTLEASMQDLNAHCLTLQSENERLRSQVDALSLTANSSSELRYELDETRRMLSQLQADFREHKEAAKLAIAERDAEIKKLRSVSIELKHDISRNSLLGEQLSDDVVCERWGKLAFDVLNWCVSVKAKMPISNITPEARISLNAITPFYTRLLLAGHRVPLLQASVAAFIATEIFGSYLFGLPEDTARILSKLEKDMLGIAAPALVNSWRTSTVKVLSQSLEEHRSNNSEGLFNDLRAILYPTLGPCPKEETLKTIIEGAIVLHHDLRAQRAQFHLIVPCVGDDSSERFDNEYMEDLSGEDETELQGKPLDLVLWPGLSRIGGERGDRVGSVTRICRAKVICSLTE